MVRQASGRRLVSEDWIRVSALAPGQALEPGCGLLWWPTGGEVPAGRNEAVALLRVVPRDRLVVACMHRVTKKGGPDFDLERLEFPTFGGLVDALLPASRATAPAPAPRRPRRPGCLLNQLTGRAARLSGGPRRPPRAVEPPA